MGNGCGKRNDETDDADDEVDDDDDDDDDVVDEFAVVLALMWFGFNAAATTAAAAAAVDGSKCIWSISNLIGTPPADSFSQILAGDQIIAFELDRVDLVDKFNGSSSSISVGTIFQWMQNICNDCTESHISIERHLWKCRCESKIMVTNLKKENHKLELTDCFIFFRCQRVSMIA